ncbi:MAG: Ig-like domain-containing domain [Ginsengibacter sp.]
MRLRNLIVFFAAISLVYLLSVIAGGCAQIGAPIGGPRDSLPPILLEAKPLNRTTHFTGKNITLNFDEYIQLQNLQQTLLVSPTPKIVPDINYKLKVVTIKIRDTLEPNTTYSIDLGNSIQDINENNPFRNFTYVFSTGSYIDSLEFSGKMKLAQTGKADSTLIVLLYNDLDDSAVLKKRPKYITRLDSTGNFRFNNLAGGTYHLFGLKDESGQKYYNNKTELFAFSDSPIIVNNNTTPVDLLAYAEEKPVQKASSVIAAADKKLKFTASLNTGLQDILTPLTLTFNNKLKNFDSTKILLTDTLFNPDNSISVRLDTTSKKVIIQTRWQENTAYRLVIPVDFATDTLGGILAKSDTIQFKTKKDGDYGSIKLNFKNLEKFKHPVLQFFSNNEVAYSYPLISTTWSVKIFNPGDYELNILDDINQNGYWDPGNYEMKKQPEKVYNIPQRLTIRANWENEKDITL